MSRMFLGSLVEVLLREPEAKVGGVLQRVDEMGIVLGRHERDMSATFYPTARIVQITRTGEPSRW